MKNLKKKRIASGIVGVSIVSMLSGLMFPAVANANELNNSDLIPNDTYFEDQWSLDANHLNLPAIWGTTIGKGQTIAVLDTGITPHSDLDDNVLNGYDMITNKTISKGEDGWEEDSIDPGNYIELGSQRCDTTADSARNSVWHGTKVAGIIAAKGENNQGIIGIAPGSKILPVRVVDSCDEYSQSDVEQGILWAAGKDMGYSYPTNNHPATVINMSIHTSDKSSNHILQSCPVGIQNAINYAVFNKNIPVVVAAGNDHQSASLGWPANCDNVITVASSLRYQNELADYSNFGLAVDITAPGGDDKPLEPFMPLSSILSILSTTNNGVDSPESYSFTYKSDAGTSFAAPHVAGTVALMRSLNPIATPQTIERVIKEKATQINTCNTNMCGAGALNAKDSVLAMKSSSSPSNLGFAFEPKGVWISNDTYATVGDTVFAYYTSVETDFESWGPWGTEYSYEWQRNGNSIPDATDISYTLTEDDYLKNISVKITASKSGYISVERTSSFFFID